MFISLFRIVMIALFLVAGISKADPVPVVTHIKVNSIIGSDDRQAIDIQNHFRAIGRLIDVAGNFRCTGTMFAPARIITAAHCVGLEGAIAIEFKTAAGWRRYRLLGSETAPEWGNRPVAKARADYELWHIPRDVAIARVETDSYSKDLWRGTAVRFQVEDGEMVTLLSFAKDSEKTLTRVTCKADLYVT